MQCLIEHIHSSNDMNEPSLWTFTVVAALVTTVGTLLGHYLKEVVLARALENWKRERTLADIHRKYRDPIVLSAIELASRLCEICTHYPTDYLKQKYLEMDVPAPSYHGARNEYFCRYKFLSTAYRLSAFLGWLELYRQELVFADTEESQTSRQLEPLFEKIREDLADGQLNLADDWRVWSDALLYREEQRAIGEAMVGTTPAGRGVLGYGAFVTATESPSHPVHRWIPAAVTFFADPLPIKDFRHTRYERLLVHLVDLVTAMEPRRAPDWICQAATLYRRRTEQLLNPHSID